MLPRQLVVLSCAGPEGTAANSQDVREEVQAVEGLRSGAQEGNKRQRGGYCRLCYQSPKDPGSNGAGESWVVAS